jgi:hypothetical protein
VTSPVESRPFSVHDAEGQDVRKGWHFVDASLAPQSEKFSVSTVAEFREVHDIWARASLGPPLVYGYIALVFLVVLMPFLLWWIGAIFRPAEFRADIGTIRDFSIAMFSGLAGVNGLAGLVIGRHFRSEGEVGAPQQTRTRRGGRPSTRGLGATG